MSRLRCALANTLRFQRLEFCRKKLTKGPNVIRQACGHRVIPSRAAAGDSDHHNGRPYLAIFYQGSGDGNSAPSIRTSAPRPQRSWKDVPRAGGCAVSGAEACSNAFAVRSSQSRGFAWLRFAFFSSRRDVGRPQRQRPELLNDVVDHGTFSAII